MGFGKTVGLCSLAGLVYPGDPALLPKLVSFLRNLSPSGPHVLLVGLSGALEDFIPAQSNCSQRWARSGWEEGGRDGAVPRAASGAFGDLKRGSMRQRHRGNQRQTSDRETEGDTETEQGKTENELKQM